MQLVQLVQGARRRAAARFERRIQHWRQLQQGKVVRDRRRIDGQLPGDLQVGFACIDTAAHEARQLQRRQSMALQVLGHLVVGLAWLLANGDRNLGNPASCAARQRRAPNWMR